MAKSKYVRGVNFRAGPKTRGKRTIPTTKGGKKGAQSAAG